MGLPAGMKPEDATFALTVARVAPDGTVAYEVVDHPSTNQLVAMARKYVLKYDRMAGTPTPT